MAKDHNSPVALAAESFSGCDTRVRHLSDEDYVEFMDELACHAEAAANAKREELNNVDS